MTNEKKLWQGDFGDQYHKRNMITDDNLQPRMVLWHATIPMLLTPSYHPMSYLEVGAGLGANLITINNIYQTHGRVPELYAIETNDKAREALSELEHTKVLKGDALNIGAPNASVDVAFTCGVLIHVNPEDQIQALKEIYRVSKKYIICMEYFSPDLREVNYHGEKALWTRDYGSLWLDNFKLRSVGYTFFWKRVSGLDNITSWVFEKVH